MACNRISKRIISYRLIVLFFITSLSLQAGKTEFGLEITYTDLDELKLFFSGSYKTDRAIGTISVNPVDPFPDNIIINITPIVNRSSNQKELITALTGVTDGALNLGKYLLKKRFCHDKKLEKQVENSYLKKHNRNLEEQKKISQLLKESLHD